MIILVQLCKILSLISEKYTLKYLGVKGNHVCDTLLRSSGKNYEHIYTYVCVYTHLYTHTYIYREGEKENDETKQCGKMITLRESR